MDIIRLYDDFRIYYQTEGHKHCRPGWVNTECPFCEGNPGLHLGWDIAGEYFVCWRCGWKPTVKTIAKLTHTSEPEAREIIRKYGGKTRRKLARNIDPLIGKRKPLKFPEGTGPLMKNHRKYLEKRGFNPDHIKQMWGVLGTGPVSKLDDIDYRNRILIPINWEGETVSFQTRDISGKHPAKYMACPEYREKVKHKHILYAHSTAIEQRKCLCVEGVTDVWRLGPGAVAVFGIKFTPYQVKILSQLFDKVVVVFDEDPQAVIQARSLSKQLSFAGVDSEYVIISGDPAEFSEQQAHYLIRKYM